MSIWTGANEAVGNMKSFNNQSGLRGLPCFAEGIHWATGSSPPTPFTEGCPGVNDKASPGRHQEQAPKQRCTFSPTTFSSVQSTTFLLLFTCRSVQPLPLEHAVLLAHFVQFLLLFTCRQFSSGFHSSPPRNSSGQRIDERVQFVKVHGASTVQFEALFHFLELIGRKCRKNEAFRYCEHYQGALKMPSLQESLQVDHFAVFF